MVGRGWERSPAIHGSPQASEEPCPIWPFSPVEGVAQEIQKVPSDHQPALDTRSWSEGGGGRRWVLYWVSEMFFTSFTLGPTWSAVRVGSAHFPTS